MSSDFLCRDHGYLGTETRRLKMGLAKCSNYTRFLFSVKPLQVTEFIQLRF